jgi:hypothetical protein
VRIDRKDKMGRNLTPAPECGFYAASRWLERFDKIYSQVQRGFLDFGEAPAKE